ncbi:MAG: flagellar hook-basal body complex protein FliE [Lautropia sp.]|nr:flagellar hook-basal body complex protein FliE [Lautropia sp.]
MALIIRQPFVFSCVNNRAGLPLFQRAILVHVYTIYLVGKRFAEARRGMMKVEFPGSALKAAADAAAAAARPQSVGEMGGLLSAGGAEKANDVSFGNLFMDALRSVSQAQNVADSQQKAFVLGESGATLEGTMLAMQKAQIGFQSALTVRNRLVQAYSEIMGLQV